MKEVRSTYPFTALTAVPSGLGACNRAPTRGARPVVTAAMAGLFACLIAASTTPALGQVCGTPPCGGGGGGPGKPITIKWLQDLEFGTLAGDVAFAGTATINPVTGTKSVTGGVYDFGGISSPAMFNVRGDKDSTFAVTLPASVTLTSGSNTMTLGNFTSSPSTVGVFDSSGRSTITVGATLQVGAGQAAGAYTGVFTVTVDYQ